MRKEEVCPQSRKINNTENKNKIQTKKKLWINKQKNIKNNIKKQQNANQTQQNIIEGRVSRKKYAPECLIFFFFFIFLTQPQEESCRPRKTVTSWMTSCVQNDPNEEKRRNLILSNVNRPSSTWPAHDSGKEGNERKEYGHRIRISRACSRRLTWSCNKRVLSSHTDRQTDGV